MHSLKYFFSLHKKFNYFSLLYQLFGFRCLFLMEASIIFILRCTLMTLRCTLEVQFPTLEMAFRTYFIRPSTSEVRFLIIEVRRSIFGVRRLYCFCLSLFYRIGNILFAYFFHSTAVL